MTRQVVPKTNQSTPKSTSSMIWQRTAVRSIPVTTPQVQTEPQAEDKLRLKQDWTQVPVRNPDRMASRKEQNLGETVGRSPLSPAQLSYSVPVQPIQAKLTIGQPNDLYEQEADRVAAKVVQQINSPGSKQSIPEDSVEGNSVKVQRKISIQGADAIASGEASAELTSAINSARGRGQPLDTSLQQTMGQAMGADFSGVRVHMDARSDRLNQSIQAKAFTTGQDVFFRQGEYQPATRGGQETIAHELTHVVQQNGGAVMRSPRLKQTLYSLDGDETREAQNVGATKTIPTMNLNGEMLQAKWGGEIPQETSDDKMQYILKRMDPDTNIKQWNIRSIRTEDKEYRTYEEVAVKLKVKYNAAIMAAIIKEELSALEPRVSTPPIEASSTSARSVLTEASSASASTPSNELDWINSRKILVPEDGILTVYRAEKSERNTLDQRRYQGGLMRWKTTDSAQEAWGRMIEAIQTEKGEGTKKVAAYAQTLRRQGHPDKLATARTQEGAYTDDYNYVIQIPRIEIYEWKGVGLGRKYGPGEEIKNDYIVLNADTIEKSTIIGFGHKTGTKEITFITDIPASMIKSVHVGDWNKEGIKF